MVSLTHTIKNNQGNHLEQVRGEPIFIIQQTERNINNSPLKNEKLRNVLLVTFNTVPVKQHLLLKRIETHTHTRINRETKNKRNE